MKLQVKNLGPIKQGEIDLDKRFYVFVGYNNSGKTYMSQVIWGLLDLEKHIKSSTIKLTDIWSSSLAKKDEIEDVLSNMTNEEKTISLSKQDYDAIIKFLYQKIKEEIIDNFNFNNKLKLLEKLEISFSIGFDYFKNTAFNYNYGLNNYYYSFKKAANSLDISVNKSEKQSNVNVLLQSDGLAFEFVEVETSIFKSYFFDFVTRHIFEHLASGKKFFLPANRAFFTNYYKYIYASLKTELDRFEKFSKKNDTINFSREYTYTAASDGLLANIYNLNINGKIEQSYYSDLLDELKIVIGGDIVNKSSNPDISSLATFKLKMENEEELDMHLSSSSVNQLTTLYLYFKYWAKESGNTLIIDEPEENLHPKNQLALLNILMKFANRNNNRVILTTHSPLITDAVNNHLHLGYLAKKYEQNIESLIEENGLEMDAEAALSHDDIGVYFFDGKSIKEYSVEEYGVDFKDFRKEQEKVEGAGDKLRGLILKQEKLKRQERLQKVAQNV